MCGSGGLRGPNRRLLIKRPIDLFLQALPSRRLFPAAFAALALGAALPAHSGDLYLGAGTSGVTAGYAQPLSERLVLRADVSTLGRPHLDRSRGGIDYQARIKADRVGAYADWYVYKGMRVTGGVTLNDAGAQLTGRGNGATVTIGGTPYPTTAQDRFDVEVKFPQVMPYLGVGWGRQPSPEKGWGLAVDVGLSVGKPRVTGQVSGPQLPGAVQQADVDRELADLRRSLGRFKGIPQVGVSLSYRF